MRQFLKDKPHKWGTKFFMTCCAETAYCLRLEVYCGTDQHTSELGGESPTKFSADPNSGPAAVVRNLHEVLPAPQDGVFHAVVTDRFYTSVQLALQLLSRNVYTVGTIQTNKQGFPPAIKAEYENHPPHIPRGTTRMAAAKCYPPLTALLWWDRKPVHLLCSGGSKVLQSCERRLRGGRKVVVPCPAMMRDYQRWMEGVDIHDQLRLQRYSLQMAVVFRKYYKTIFLGLVDMAIVNAYIVYREAQKQRGEPPADHAKFLRVLQAQMLELTPADFTDAMMSPGPPAQGERMRALPAEHKLTEFPDWQYVGVIRKRPQHQCKVCSIRKQKKGERCATRFFCEACSDGNKRVYLCDRVRPGHYPGNTLTCHQIWHVKWNNGQNRPRPLVGRDIQMRGLGKKRRRASDAEEEEDAVEEQEDMAEEQEDAAEDAEGAEDDAGEDATQGA
ncbi:hypothetical protein PR001_g24222 [Phytophthora rubi]|uniref:PiggyBac transposable element-derived protein domain-containing protein n=1 Tax=Phytophthora rubi TaxID=129364 RepID=A0A6A3IJE0_9STRA|nr:hypothetical protein PR001_g24222 [Phytophthora rubi]